MQFTFFITSAKKKAYPNGTDGLVTAYRLRITFLSMHSSINASLITIICVKHIFGDTCSLLLRTISHTESYGGLFGLRKKSLMTLKSYILNNSKSEIKVKLYSKF